MEGDLLPANEHDRRPGLDPTTRTPHVPATTVHYVEVLSSSTTAKPDTRGSSVLRGQGACLATLAAGRRIALRSAPVTAAGQHLRISPVVPLTGTSGTSATAPCTLRDVYVFAPHVRIGTVRQPKVLVLMYHEIVPTDADAIAADDVVLSRFVEQLDWLNTRFTTIDASQLYAARVEARPLPARPVLLTFDDGYRGNHTYAFPELAARSMHAVFFVHTDYVGSSVGAHPKVSWDDLREIDASPLFEVHSHTRSHPRLTTLDDTQLASELAGSRSRLQAELGGTRHFLAYPFGDYDARVLDAAARHYAMTFAVGRPRLGNTVPGMHDMPRLGIGRSVTTLAQFETIVSASLAQP